ncbi:PAP2 superfamily protein [Anaerocolumna jejuensis DSM 15929]|uniref:PAP2 superfamily protein n=1 Tax=Anaerocolumna jejuensis DSM 15929 TaxID=1121322 RepID=A0A1M7AZP6_9FIRM|nr:phosphatase PAP2 family protein [Anaerocolumna jejuensis]SHL48212.1 PAP2 superfamily protein [Anaerocolumna jejuensis DSM 15929]
MKNLIHKYKHAWVLSYFVIYMVWFFYLERSVTKNFYTVHIKLDDMIPFNEWFLIPYLLWFLYIFSTVSYFFLTSRSDFYKLTAFLFIGMTICLIIYTIWPNGQDLRPNLDALGRDNVLIDIIRHLYSTDTATNVCPSIHVFNSIGAAIAINKSEALKKKKWLTIGSVILTVLICMSTVFIKQHSVFDVFMGTLLAVVMYLGVYVWVGSKQAAKAKEKKLSAEF